jgi:hypothetical protein
VDSPLLRHLFSRALRASLASSLVLAGCGSDQTVYASPVCEGVSFAVSGLSPAVPVDFVQLRYVSSKPDASTAAVIASSGTACATASDKAACESALSNLSSSSGFRTSPYHVAYLGTTRGDEVVAHTSLEALKSFLGPIDTAQEAALVASASSSDLSCREMPPGAVRTNEGGGFTVLGNLHECSKVIQFVLDVSVSGEVKELRRYVLKDPYPDMQC